MGGSAARYDTWIRSGARRLTGSQRRRGLAAVATERGDGRARQAERRFGGGRQTVATGLPESRSGLRCLEDFPTRGRRRSVAQDPPLAADIRAVVEPQSDVDPELRSERRYTNRSAAEVRAARVPRGDRTAELPRERPLREILNRRNYRLPRIRKGKPLQKTQETDAICAHGRPVRDEVKDDGVTRAISRDTKAKVNLGDSVRGGNNPDRRRR